MKEDLQLFAVLALWASACAVLFVLSVSQLIELITINQ